MLTWLVWLGVAIGLWCIAAVLVVAVYASWRQAGRELFVERN